MSEAWYREVPPAPFLRRFVECYWFLRGSADSLSDPEPILPDGRMEMVFHLGAPFRRLHRNGRMETQPARMLIGQMENTNF